MINSKFFKSGLVIFIYLLFFFFLFLSFPLHDSLISEGDSWYYVAKFNYYLNTLRHFFLNESYSQYFYPDSKPFLNGEPSFGLFPIWLFFKLILKNEVWTYFLLVVVIFALNSISVSFLVRTFVKNVNQEIAFLSGLFFSCSMFMFANIENINTLYIAPGFFAIYLFYRLIDNNISSKKTEQILFVFFMLLQLVSSVYNFCYILIFLLAIILVKRSMFFQNLNKHKMRWATIIGVGFLLSLLYLYVVIISPDKKSTHWNFSSGLEAVKIFSITLDDFFRVIPNTLYSKNENVNSVELYQSFFPGFIFVFFLVLGIYYNKFKNFELFIGGSFALLIGIGTYAIISGKFVLLPLGFIFEKFDLYSFYRFPFRIFLLLLLPLVVLFSIGLDSLFNRFKLHKWILFMVFLIFLFENIPFKRNYFNFKSIEREGVFLKSQLSNNDTIILFLPAGDFMYRDGSPPLMNKTIYIFMYWQTIIKKNVINGNSSFHPLSNVKLNNSIYISETPYQSFVDYCLEYNVSTIVHYSNKWNLDTFPLDSNNLELMFKENGIRYIKR